MRRGGSLSIQENIQVEVKWFNSVKGFGFVATPNGDAFLHISAVEPLLNSADLLEGSVLLADISPGTKGQQVTRVHHVIKAGQRTQRGFPRRVNGIRAERSVGTVKWFSRDRGFGFIIVDGGGRDVYVSAKSVEKAGLEELKEAQRVRFVSVERDRGPIAEDVEVIPK